ncbi:hypothetical protein FB45DRAFT_873108 [Roridomyces roridus]|uniref:Uncharacterized protein n=1 Tax=Roridomyces roridus TaxID=1738132 RepID=A0AAD7FD09_9AGAR|nr:hypothetical protein FB45DRAFT_873108 [Roridomyces roridus]
MNLSTLKLLTSGVLFLALTQEFGHQLKYSPNPSYRLVPLVATAVAIVSNQLRADALDFVLLRARCRITSTLELVLYDDTTEARSAERMDKTVDESIPVRENIMRQAQRHVTLVVLSEYEIRSRVPSPGPRTLAFKLQAQALDQASCSIVPVLRTPAACAYMLGGYRTTSTSLLPARPTLVL